MSKLLEQSLLGKPVRYAQHYAPELLFPVLRQMQREEIGINETSLPFYGVDIWNAFELSWLNTKGRPMVALGEFIFPCESRSLIESKSLKLYLNSFNPSVFSSLEEVAMTIQKDLTQAAGDEVRVKLTPLDTFDRNCVIEFDGICLDNLNVACDRYEVTPELLTTHDTEIETTETVFTHLLKSNCLVTGQPDWGSVQLRYRGKKIDHENLLKYLVSFRNHNGFHEQCVEMIFMDILKYCQPSELTVYARYMRRGGLDINPYRSTKLGLPENKRISRQ